MEPTTDQVNATLVEVNEFKYGAEKDRTGWKYKTEGGKTLSVFSDSINSKLELNKPLELMVETKTTGQFTNYTIKAVKVAGEWYEGEKKAGRSGGGMPGKADPEKLKQTKDLEMIKNRNIHASVALQEAVKVHQLDDKRDPEMILKTAEAFDKWLTKKREG